MSHQKKNLYPVALHGLLIALATTTLALAWQNRALERRLNPLPPEPPFVAGDVMEPFAAQDLEGREVLVDTRATDGRERWVFFFTTTCPACAQNQAQWRQLHDKIGNRHDVVGVSLDPLEATLRYREERDLSYEVVAVPDPNAFSERYSMNSVPFTLRIGVDGKIRDAWLGVLTDRTLDEIQI